MVTPVLNVQPCDLGVEMIIDLLKGVEDLHEDKGQHISAVLKG